MFKLLKKLFGKSDVLEEYLVYCLKIENPIGQVRVFVINGEPNKYRFEWKTPTESHSFITRRYLTAYLPSDELQTGMYDKLVNKKFNLNISFEPKHKQGTSRDSEQSNL